MKTLPPRYYAYKTVEVEGFGRINMIVPIADGFETVAWRKPVDGDTVVENKIGLLPAVALTSWRKSFEKCRWVARPVRRN